MLRDCGCSEPSGELGVVICHREKTPKPIPLFKCWLSCKNGKNKTGA
jgi:hypothetical protein